MKKRILFGFSLSTILSLSFVSAILSTKENKNIKVEGYSTSSLPTTIDLNDTSEANIRSYYSSLNNKPTSERQGNNLLKNLKTILKNGQKYYSYDSGSAIWQMYEITDRDWDKSPASSISGYNSSTNKITGYSYGTSTSSKGSNPYLHALYINRNVTNQVRAWDDHQQTQWGINREHVWAKAEGFDSGGSGGARGDAMHLMAANGYANNIHSNNFFGYVNTSNTYTNCGSKYSNLSGNLSGKSKTLGGSTTVFEPQDSDKGDIARAIFYMVARYNYLSGSDSDGIDGANPNLSLSQSLSDWSSSGFTSSTSTKGYMGIMTDLLAWHHADPVDEYEIHRNNLLYTNFTNNRNPFIDFPEWADFIWGSVNYNGSTYVSHNTTPTGYATPSSDTINGYNSGGSTVSVTGISLDKSTATVGVDGTITLTPTITPSNATNKGITWTSSNTSKATVSDGLVTGKAAGTATITATTKDGGYTASCTVTVKSISSISVSGQTTAFETGNNFVFGGTVTAHYSDNTTADVTSYASFSGYDLSTAGNQTVTVTYGNKTTTYSITVTASTTLTGSVSIATYASDNSWSNGTKHTTVAIDDHVTATATGGGNTGKYYTSGNEWRFYQTENAQITISVGDGYELDSVTFTYGITNTGVLNDSSDNAVASGTEVSVSGNSVTFSVGNSGTATNGQVKFTAIVVEYHATSSGTITLSSIAVKTAPTKIIYTAGDDFAPAGLVITATYSDSSTEDISYSNNEDSFEFDPSDSLQTSDTSVTISYGGKTCTQSITVGAVKTLSSITLNTDNVTKAFYVGDTFEHDNLVVTAHFSDSSSDVVSSSATVTTPDMSTAGEKTVTVSYTYGGSTQTASYTITVVESGGVITGSQRVVSKSDSTYFENGSIYLSGTEESGSASCSAFTITHSKNSGSSIAYTYDEIRVYASHSLTIQPSNGYTITSVVITANSSSYASAVGGSSITNCSKTVNESTVTLTPTDGTSSLGFVNSAQSRINYVVVNYSYTPASSLSSITLDTTNVQTTFAVGDTFNYTGLVVTAHYTDSTSSVVTPTSVSTPSTATIGNKTVTVSYTESEVTKTATYTITVNANPSISWTAPTINTYTGSTLSGTDVNGWAVTYNDGAGHQTVLTYSQLTVKLGGTTISIPHTWTASDDGKTLTATYNSVTTSASAAVQITQSVHAINVETPGSTETSDLTFTSSCGGTGTADDGKTWTVTSDAAESTYDSTKGIHYGTGSAAVEYIQLVSNSFTSGTITQVVVNASGASGVTGSVSVTVGGNTFGEVQSFNSTASDKTFTGSASAGQIVVRIYKSAAAVKAIYCKSVVVTYSTESEITNIANSTDHIAAQRVAVKFAKAFNAAMDTTSGCTTNLSSAWSACQSAYNTFKSEAAALGETEEAYAKNLIKYATAQYSDNSGEACIERMMKTYEICVQKHGQTAFMSDLVTLSRISNNNPLQMIRNNANTVAIVIIVSMISLAAIGGYFFLRRKKED